MGAGATGPGPKYDTRVPLGSTGPAFTVGRGGRGGGRAEPAPKPPSDEGAWGWLGGGGVLLSLLLYLRLSREWLCAAAVSSSCVSDCAIGCATGL